ncbi:hypothetical protein HED55_07665 [Ochrobactrum haematophilum]|uniref:Uncharacterized protein n=1 Tax=Brucella haematophila TaxID=419474 RepID=A0ABX1DKH5_9HYPH|nr:hypothetical protein [Brucella haematophila]
MPYTFAVDPVARAGETLASLLFRRGDVKTASFAVPFMMQGETSLGDSLETREPERLKTLLALVGGIGLFASGLQWPETTAKGIEINYRNVALDNVLERLKQAGLSLKDNATDPYRGIFASATGEILLERDRTRMRVVTPRTEALAFADLKDSLTLGQLTLSHAEGRGLVSVSALDTQPLATSEKMLVIFATDARNTGMRFRDDAQKEIEDWGRLPVTLLRNRVDFRLRVLLRLGNCLPSVSTARFMRLSPPAMGRWNFASITARALTGRRPFSCWSAGSVARFIEYWWLLDQTAIGSQ